MIHWWKTYLGDIDEFLHEEHSLLELVLLNDLRRHPQGDHVRAPYHGHDVRALLFSVRSVPGLVQALARPDAAVGLVLHQG